MTTRLDISAESGIIGAMMLDDGCVPEVLESVAASDFVTDTARQIYTAVKDLYDEGRAIDPVTVLDRLGNPADVKDYIAVTMELAATVNNVAVHCRILKDEAQKRKLGEIARQIEEGQLVGRRWQEVAASAYAALGSLESSEEGAATSPESMTRWMNYYFLIKEHPEKAFCRTGYRTLDRALGGGMHNGEVYIIAGRPGMGKTTQGIDIAERIAASGRAVLFVSLEMSEMQLTAKRIAGVAGISYTGIISGRLSAADEALAIQTAIRISERPFYMADRVATVEDIAAYARSVKDLAAIVVDYLGLIQTGERPASRYEEMTRISAQLKAFAKRINRPVLALCQLNRENTTRADKKPTLSDLRDSGAIEQDAGGVILLHRESYYRTDEEPPEYEPIELIIAKSRHAMPQTVRMLWHGRSGRITEYDNDHGDMPV